VSTSRALSILAVAANTLALTISNYAYNAIEQQILLDSATYAQSVFKINNALLIDGAISSPTAFPKAPVLNTSSTPTREENFDLQYRYHKSRRSPAVEKRAVVCSSKCQHTSGDKNPQKGEIT